MGNLYYEQMKKLLCILFLAISFSANAQNTIVGQTYINTDPSWAGIYIDDSAPISFAFLNNSVTSLNTINYQLNAGDESVGYGNNNNLDGEVIAGNKFVWNGTLMTAGTHGIFTGCNINTVIRYNYMDGTPLALIKKAGSEMDDVSGGVYYNIVIDPLSGTTIKGIGGVKVYNNTYYQSRSVVNAGNRGLVELYNNTDVSPNIVSTGNVVKNNIFYTKHKSYSIRLLDAGALATADCDYNVYWCEDGDHMPVFNYLGVSHTWAEWRAHGFDAHSVVLNPNFVDYVNLVPEERLNYGTALSSPFQTGLSSTATWVVGSGPATANQDSQWQIGARILTTTPPEGTDTYYLSPSGSDSNTGTISSPWFTLNKAWTVVAAGDVVYMRGGTYYYNSQQYLSGKSGAAGNMITIQNYPGEVSIITKSGSYPAPGYNTGGIYFSGDYIHWKGITITGFTQMNHWMLCGIWGNYFNHCTFEMMKVSANGGYGEWNQGSMNDNTWLNCDFYNNQDPLTSGDAYGNADGMGFQNTNASATNYITDCRFWWNSDDGLDFGNSDGLMVVDGCQAWYNGFIPGTFTLANIYGSGGNGFKAYYTPSHPTLDTHKRTYQNCLAFHNVGGGFDFEETNCITWYYNNVAYHNGDVGSSVNYQAGFHGWGAALNYAHILKNNISYDHQYTSGNTMNFGSNYVNDHNSWNGGVTVTDADFVSLSMTGVDGTRNSDGSLPVLNFLKLASGSYLIDAGIDVGLSYLGKYPDIGAFESVEAGVVLPTVTTSATITVTVTTAAVSGEVTNLGGGTVTSRGFCYSTSATPDLTDSYVSVGSGLGTFSTVLTGLSASTTYYLRAFATNEAGTSYGAERTFTTSPTLTGTGFVKVWNSTLNKWVYASDKSGTKYVKK